MYDNQKNSSEVISSNLDFITNNMNALRNQVHNSNSLSNTHTINFKKNDGIYGNMNNMINNYFNSTEKLLEKFDKETEMIINIGKIYYELDNQLSKKAGDL